MTNEELKRLISRSKSWNTEDHKYICLGNNGNAYFSNGLDCDGVRRWNKNSFQKMLEKKALENNPDVIKETETKGDDCLSIKTKGNLADECEMLKQELLGVLKRCSQAEDNLIIAKFNATEGDKAYESLRQEFFEKDDALTLAKDLLEIKRNTEQRVEIKKARDVGIGNNPETLVLVVGGEVVRHQVKTEYVCDNGKVSFIVTFEILGDEALLSAVLEGRA